MSEVKPTYEELVKKVEELEANNVTDQEAQFRLLVDNAPEPIFIQLDGKFAYLNNAALELYGAKSDKEIIGTAVINRIHPDFAGLVKERISALNNKGIPVDKIKYKHLRLDMTEIDVEVSAVPLKFDNRNGALVFVRDINENEKIKKELVHSHNLMQNIIEHSRSGVAVFDMDMNYIYVSQRYIDEYRIKDKNIIGKSHYDVFPEIPERWKEIHQKSLNGEVLSSDNDSLLRQDGSVDWIRWECRPWQQADGSIRGMILYSEMLTERMRMEEELIRKNMELEASDEEIRAANEELVTASDSLSETNSRLEAAKEQAEKSLNLLNNLAYHVPGVVYQYRLYPDGRSAFPYSSPGMQEIYEVSSEEVREDASPVFTRIHPDDFQEIVDTINESALNQTDYHSEFRVILPRQGLRWRNCDARPELLEDGSTLWHGVINDITDRKLAEEKIKEQQILFETMFNTISEGVVITNTNREILLVNKGMEKTFGYLPEEVIGKSTKVLYAEPDNFSRTGKEVFDEDASSTENLYLTYYKDKFNNVFPGETFGSKLFDSKGEWIGNLGIMRNITERIRYIEDLKIAREKAEESDRLKTAFLHNISHEIRTPLNSIIGFSDLLNAPDILPDKRKHFTDIIVQSGYQLLSIITDIINIATIEAGQAKLEIKEIQLNNFMELLYQQFLLKLDKQHISLAYTSALPEKEDKVLTDTTKLTEVLSNLVGNAIKFTKEGGVKFGYEVKESFLEFYIEDTGIGIPDEMHEEIFYRFRQLETTSNRLYGGSGLGLSISKSYIELMGGKIWLTSNPVSGTTFYFTIPYKKAAEAESLHEVSLNNKLFKTIKVKTILIAEDEDTNFFLLEELLSGSGIKIIRAINGLEAVELCKLNPEIDLILMDLKMPLFDGYQAAMQIKEFRPELPIIAQSAYSTESDRNKAIASGCVDIITKPIDLNLFRSKINQYLNSEHKPK